MDNEVYVDLVELRKAIGFNNPPSAYASLRYDIFEKFALLFNEIDPQARLLIISFMKNYLIINDYRQACVDFCEEIEKIYAGKGIVIMPVCEDKEIKSGHTISYEIKTLLNKDLFKSIDFPDGESSFSKIDLSDKITIIVDDFIGTGDQISEFIDRNRIEKDKSNVFSIVMQTTAYKNVTNLVSRIYTFKPLRYKAIEDGFSIGEMTPKFAYSVYDQIFDLTDISPFMKYGYADTEALVTMKRTPDNTLSILWDDAGKGGSKWPAPLLRR